MKDNKETSSYIDGAYVRNSKQPEVVVVRKHIINENKNPPKKG